MTLTFRLFIYYICRTCGAMDNASDYGSEDSRFESWQVLALFEFPFLTFLSNFLRMRQSGVKKNKSEVSGDFLSN